MTAKTQEMVKRRQGHVPDLQNQLSNDAARQAQLQAAQQRQHQMMLSQMAARGLGKSGPQHGFQPMQNPMQVPGMPQQPQQIGMGMAAANMLQNRPDQRQFQMQMPQGRQGAVFQVDPLHRLAPQDRNRVNEFAMRLMSQADEMTKNQIRQMMQTKLTPAQLQECAAQRKDTVFTWYQNSALSQLQARAAQQQQQRNLMQQRAGGMAANAVPPGALQGQMNPALMNTLGQQPGMADGQAFAPNMESIRNEQQLGLRAQQAGQVVVPASAAPGRNATPGQIPGLPPQPAPVNHPGPNHTPLPPQVQQTFGIQQVQLDPTAAQVQAQPGVRAVAGRVMQGQPGAMGAQSAPPQASQSPAMNTLNAPMRQPPVPMGQGNGQAMNQGNTPMAATLNPQFNHQNNTRPQSLQGNMNNAAMAGMVPNLNPEARAAMGAVPENGAMREFYAKLQEHQRAGNNGFPGPKPGMIPGMPGQIQGGPMPGANQAALLNANQKNNGAMQPTGQPPTLQQQQQLAAEKEHLLAIIQSPQGRAAMNNMDIPVQILTRMRGSIPPEIRKWVQLKQFIQNNPAALPPQMHSHLNNYQFMQFKAMLDKKKAPTAPVAVPGPQPPGGPVPQQPGFQPQPLPPGFSYPPALSHVTRQELEAARQRDQRCQAMSDDALSELLRKAKRDGYAKKAWEQFQQSQQARGNNNNPAAGPQKAAMPVPPTPTTQQGGVIPAPHPNVAQGMHQQAAQQKPAGAQMVDMAAAPSLGTGLPARGALNPSPATAAKNLKRPNPDEAGDPTGQQGNAMQRPAPQPGARPPQAGPKPTMEQLMKLSPEQLAKFSPEQLTKLAPEQRAYVLRTRAGPPQTGPPQSVSRLREVAEEGHRLALQEVSKEKPLAMSPAELAETRLKLGAAVDRIGQLRAASNIAKWYHLTKDDSRARMFFKTVCVDSSLLRLTGQECANAVSSATKWAANSPMSMR